MSSSRKRVSKILLLGDSFVGKSSLIQRFVNKEFSQEFRATIGCDFLMKQVETSKGVVSMQLWDTAGQERFESLGRGFYRGADGLILVFDITNVESFRHLDSRRQDFMELAAVTDPDNFPVVVIANKIDREQDRKVKMEDVKLWVGQFASTELFECSAKEGTGVEEAFLQLSHQIQVREANQPQLPYDRDTVYPLKPRVRTDSKKCC